MLYLCQQFNICIFFKLLVSRLRLCGRCLSDTVRGAAYCSSREPLALVLKRCLFDVKPKRAPDSRRARQSRLLQLFTPEPEITLTPTQSKMCDRERERRRDSSEVGVGLLLKPADIGLFHL